ncbi:MAG: hypothetical protein U5R06_05445 [candidate division KSB1 bacterium]|nr:hypothetical protein [candidate division KSB1 bacterium]
MRVPFLHKKYKVIIISSLLLSGLIFSVVGEQSETKNIKTGRCWAVVSTAGDGVQGSAASGWFPAEFNVISFGENDRSQNGGASEIGIIHKNYMDTAGETYEYVMAGPSDQLGNILLVEPFESYVRYGLPDNSVNNQAIETPERGQVAPDKMIGTCEHVLTSVFDYETGIRAERKVFAWSQPFHDNYIVTEFIFTNITDQMEGVAEQTFEDVWFSQAQEDPDLAWGQNPEPENVGDDSPGWIHYYGGRPDDSLRVYYRLHADDPTSGGDNMGNPAFDQEGRLMRPGASFWTFLHVSKEPYSDPAQDENDPLQPITTYVAKSGLIGGAGGDNIFDPNMNTVNAALGKIADQNPMPGALSGTHHEINNDETGLADFGAFSQYVSSGQGGNRPRIRIGPIKDWEPGESVRYVYAAGHASLDLARVKEIGKKFIRGELDPPPNLPNPTTGFLPENFKFPEGASQADINKDLWLSTVVDSVHKTISRIKHNYEHDWQAPMAPPPPSLSVKGLGGAAQLEWERSGSRRDAELCRLSHYA